MKLRDGDVINRQLLTKDCTVQLRNNLCKLHHPERTDHPYYVWNTMMHEKHPAWRDDVHNPSPNTRPRFPQVEIKSKTKNGRQLRLKTTNRYCACGVLISFTSKPNQLWNYVRPSSRSGGGND